MGPILVSLLLSTPAAIVTVPSPAPAAVCSTRLQDARQHARAAEAKLDRAVAGGDIISIRDLERITPPGVPVLPPARKAFLVAVDCLTDRGAAGGLTRSDGALALRAAHIAAAYRRPNEAVSRLEVVLDLWPRGVVAEQAKAMAVEALLIHEGETGADAVLGLR